MTCAAGQERDWRLRAADRLELHQTRGWRADGLLGYYSCSATQTTWRMSNGPRRVSLFSVPARKMDQKILKEMKNKLKSEWNIWEASAVTKDLRWRLSNSLNHARLVLIIPALPASNKTSSLVIFTIILMNLSNMQIIKTSIPDAELHKTQHDNFLCSHLTVIVTSDIWVSGRGEGAGEPDMIGPDSWDDECLTSGIINTRSPSQCHLWFSDLRIKQPDCHHQPQTERQTLILSSSSTHTLHTPSL